MKIAAINVTYPNKQYSKPLQFTGIEDSDNRKSNNNGLAVGNAAGSALTLAVMLFGIAFGHQKTSEKYKSFLEKTEQIAASDSIKTDTFTVRDVNKDKNPDLILYKKDNSKVIIDFANQNILQEKNTLESIK